MRTESDLLGELQVPKYAYYGINTQRALENFQITEYRLHPELIKTLAIVKKAAAYANKSKLEKEGVFQYIVDACDCIINGQYHEHFVVDPIQGGAGTSLNMNANEVIANIALEKMGQGGMIGHKLAPIKPLDHINMAQSTNDVIPTAARICIRKLLNELLDTMSSLHETFKGKAKEFDNIVKIGRTHLQDAVPIRLGQEFDAYARVLQRDIERINKTGDYLHEVNMGATAVGTALNTDPVYVKKVIEHLGILTGLPIRRCESLVDGTQNTDCFTEVSATLRICMTNMSKVANDLRLMASGPTCGLGEITLKPLQEGSSIMPDKVNPVLPELINQVAFQVIGNDLTVNLASAAGQFELNVMMPVLIFNLIQSVGMMNNAFKAFDEKCVKEITVSERNVKSMEYYVKKSASLSAALTPYIGHDRAARCAEEARKNNLSLYEVCLKNEDLVRKAGGEENLKKILDPIEMTKKGENL